MTSAESSGDFDDLNFLASLGLQHRSVDVDVVNSRRFTATFLGRGDRGSDG